MSRPLRIEYPDAWHHVMNRGRRGENVFADDADYRAFIKLLQETSEMFDLRVSAFCLMSNHYHLLVQTPTANLGRAMRHVNGVYTQRFNRQWNLDGQLFRGRYKSVLVEEDSHLLELLRYIHRNPVRANICTNVSDYPWSSHKGYISSVPGWSWLHKNFLLHLFAKDSRKAQIQYEGFVKGEDSAKVTDFFNKKRPASIFGSLHFIERIKPTFPQLQRYEVPQSKCLAPTVTEIKKAVCRFYSVEKTTLEQAKRGIINEPRNVAVYLARKKCGLSLNEIGQEFGLEKYSSVSSIVSRTANQLSYDKQLQNRIYTIIMEINKSQAKT